MHLPDSAWKNGEDGTIQGLFELSGIPYVGCGHMSSAICMDKEMAHIVMEHAGISCAPFVCVYEADDLDYRKVYEHAKETLGLPIFIKPANAGSSFGIHRMESFDGFEEAMKDAFYHDGKGKVILETTIEGFEIGVAVMGNKELLRAVWMKSKQLRLSSIMRGNMRWWIPISTVRHESVRSCLRKQEKSQKGISCHELQGNDPC